MGKNNQDHYTVKLIKYGSKEHSQARQLRYELFFAEHSLPWSTVCNDHYPGNLYAAVMLKNHLIAYGELIPQEHLIYQICQMVVHPEYQRQNFGRTLLLDLIGLAQDQGAISLILNSRLTAIAFYQKLGFSCFGNEFPSATTGVMHIAMKRKL